MSKFKKLIKYLSIGTVDYLLLAGLTLAAETTVGTNSSSTTGYLFGLGPLMNQIYNNIWILAGALAGISLLWLWMSGHLANVQQKADRLLDNRKGIKNWFIDCFLVVIGYILLSQWVIPTLKQYQITF